MILGDSVILDNVSDWAEPISSILAVALGVPAGLAAAHSRRRRRHQPE